jgi:hypothetical protein
MHARETEFLRVEADARFSPGELNDVPDAALSAGVYESALGFDHLLVGGGDHERSFDAVQRGIERLGPKHVALYDLHTWQSFEQPCSRTTSYQGTNLPPFASEFTHYRKPAQTRCACDKNHRFPFSPLTLPVVSI